MDLGSVVRHTSMYAHSLTHTHTHTLSLTHTHTHTLSLSHTITYTHSLSHTQSHTHTLSLTHNHIHTCALECKKYLVMKMIKSCSLWPESELINSCVAIHQYPIVITSRVVTTIDHPILFLMITFFDNYYFNFYFCCVNVTPQYDFTKLFLIIFSIFVLFLFLGSLKDPWIFLINCWILTLGR